LVTLIVAVLWLLYRTWSAKNRRAAVAAEPITAVRVDPADENVLADQMAGDEWMQLGRELLQRGELRLALRAFYLASLAQLAERNLITLARFKSNNDYARELRRRSHALPDIFNLFSDNVSVFERTWYGLHEITQDAIQRFTANIERIRAAA
jgi:hypothetical protein